jgi:hypothetical protein
LVSEQALFGHALGAFSRGNHRALFSFEEWPSPEFDLFGCVVGPSLSNNSLRVAGDENPAQVLRAQWFAGLPGAAISSAFLFLSTPAARISHMTFFAVELRVGAQTGTVSMNGREISVRNENASRRSRESRTIGTMWIRTSLIQINSMLSAYTAPTWLIQR